MFITVLAIIGAVVLVSLVVCLALGKAAASGERMLDQEFFAKSHGGGITPGSATEGGAERRRGRDELTAAAAVVRPRII